MLTSRFISSSLLLWHQYGRTPLTLTLKARGVVQLVEYLSSTHKSLGLVPSTTYIMCGGNTCNSGTQEVEARGLEVQVNLDYIVNLRTTKDMCDPVSKTKQNPHIKA